MAAIVVAMFVLSFGWVAGVEAIIYPAKLYGGMAPSTGLCVILVASALLINGIARRPEDAAVSRAVHGLAALTAVIVFADEVAALVTDYRGLDPLLFADRPDAPHATMAVGTGIGFLLAAGGLATMRRQGRTAQIAAVTLPTLGLLLSSAAVIGQLFESQALPDTFIFSSMSMTTGTTFILLFVAMLLARPNEGWVAAFTGDAPGDANARRMLAVAILLPLALCYGALEMTNAGIVDANFRLGLVALLTIVAIGSAVANDALARSRAAQELNEAFHALETTVEEREVLLGEVYHRVKNNLQQLDAILYFESSKMSDADAKAAFNRMRGRIQALSAAHQLLISSATLSKLDIATFLHQLCENIAEGNGLNARGDVLRVESISDTASLEIATTLGLLVQELVMNAIKHAVPESGALQIDVIYQALDDGERRLIVRDNGAASPAAPSPDAFGIGGMLVQSLAQQLRGSVEYSSDEGLQTSIRFPISQS